MLYVNRRTGRIALSFTAFQIGKDLCCVLTGGDFPHIGVVSLSIPRLSLTGSGELSATTSNISVSGHKDDEISRKVSRILASRLNMVTVVCCGIHIDDITNDEIQAVIEMTEDCTEDLIEQIKGGMK